MTEFEDPTTWEGGWKGDEAALSAESGSITVQHVDNDPSSGPTSAVPPTIGLQNVFVSLDTHSFTFSQLTVCFSELLSCLPPRPLFGTVRVCRQRQTSWPYHM